MEKHSFIFQCNHHLC